MSRCCTAGSSPLCTERTKPPGHGRLGDPLSAGRPAAESGCIGAGAAADCGVSGRRFGHDPGHRLGNLAGGDCLRRPYPAGCLSGDALSMAEGPLSPDDCCARRPAYLGLPARLSLDAGRGSRVSQCLPFGKLLAHKPGWSVRLRLSDWLAIGVPTRRSATTSRPGASARARADAVRIGRVPCCVDEVNQGTLALLRLTGVFHVHSARS